jgi:hypothetical protein
MLAAARARTGRIDAVDVGAPACVGGHVRGRGHVLGHVRDHVRGHAERGPVQTRAHVSAHWHTCTRARFSSVAAARACGQALAHTRLPCRTTAASECAYPSFSCLGWKGPPPKGSRWARGESDSEGRAGRASARDEVQGGEKNEVCVCEGAIARS